jgi:hypothetical protein
MGQLQLMKQLQHEWATRVQERTMSVWFIYDETLKRVMQDHISREIYKKEAMEAHRCVMPVVTPRMPSNWWSLFEMSGPNLMNLPRPPEAAPRANPKNPEDNIWDHMDKETDEFLRIAGPEHFGPRPKTVGWHVAPRTEQRKGKTMNENPPKEFPFAEHRLADSFEEFDYSVNAPSEGGLSIDVINRDDDAAERILRARIARQQQWPFCPTHQRNVDLEFNHDGVGCDRTIHEAYWICLDCRQESRGR